MIDLNNKDLLFKPLNVLKKYSKGDSTIWVLVILLWLLSILIVYSASGFMTVNMNVKSSMFLFKQLMFIGFGFIIMYLTHKADYIKYYNWTSLFYILSIILLSMTLIWGIELNGAKRWLRIPYVGLQFQPSDLAKVAMVMFVSKQVSQNLKPFDNYFNFFKTFVLPILIISGLIIPYNLSTGLLMIIIGFLILFIGRVQIKYLLVTIFIGFVLPILLIFWLATNFYDSDKQSCKPLPNILQVGRVPTWIKRVQGYVFEKKSDENYQNQQAKIAIARGKFFGTGPGNSEQRYFLPSSYADFIFSILIEEYGLLGGVLIMLIYFWFLIRCIKIFIHCQYAFGALVVIGLSFMIVLQALINMMVNVDILPNTGVTLPLISMGGTSYLVYCFAIGVILSVAKTISQQDDKEKNIDVKSSLTPNALI